jgi:S-layer homology domain
MWSIRLKIAISASTVPDRSFPLSCASLVEERKEKTSISLTVLPKNYFAIARTSFLVSLLGLLSACSGNGNIENLFAADPKLKENTPTSTVTPQPTQTPEQTQGQLPEDFPRDIPRYPQAELVSSEPGRTIWRSPDPSNAIAAFYQEQFQSQNWQIVTPFNPEGGAENRLVARQSDLEVAIAIPTTSSNKTEFAIEYQRPNNAAQPQPQTSPENQIASDTPVEFSDLDNVAEPLRQSVQDLAQLGVLTANPVNSDRFNPDATISRREYARWLVAANNKFYANQPGKQIRLGEQSDEPIFKDIPKNDPDFAVIQGLAEAGLIPSTLTNDNSAALFRPDAPLTREVMILWKAPLDNRKALPTASIDGIKESWGFQDASKIDTKALRSLYSDYQNGDRSIIRRVYGYTTLFQPKKQVTRAEAAASLEYFGFQGDGITAQDALKIQGETSG